MTVKRIFVTAIAALTFPLAAHAATTDAARPDPVLARIAALQGQWAKIKYQTPDTGAQIDAIHRLERAMQRRKRHRQIFNLKQLHRGSVV